MVQFNPLLPVHFLILYLSSALLALIVCVFSGIAILQTKRTPYATKLLSVGLLTYDSIFLIVSSVARLFDLDDAFVIGHTSRGCQLAAQLIIGCMALERLFVLNWPYLYLRIITTQRTRIVCLSVCIVGFLQYALARVGLCYARNKPVNCGFVFGGYLILCSLLLPAISYVSFIKIFKIIRNSEKKHKTKEGFRHYKGTVATFLVLTNSAIGQLVWVGLSVIFFSNSTRNVPSTGMAATLADSWNILNCFVDPMIYVIWFRETRMELLKICKSMWPCMESTSEDINRIRWLNLESKHGQKS